jgi:hypothetical protein
MVTYFRTDRALGSGCGPRAANTAQGNVDVRTNSFGPSQLLCYQLETLSSTCLMVTEVTQTSGGYQCYRDKLSECAGFTF